MVIQIRPNHINIFINLFSVIFRTCKDITFSYALNWVREQNIEFLIWYTVHAPLKAATCIFFTPFLKTISLFLRTFSMKILSLCMISIQERVIMARTVFKVSDCHTSFLPLCTVILAIIPMMVQAKFLVARWFWARHSARATKAKKEGEGCCWHT